MLNNVNKKIPIGEIARVKKCMTFFSYGNLCRKIALSYHSVDMNGFSDRMKCQDIMQKANKC